MKKKILTLMIISVFVCLFVINNGVNVHASEGNITDNESETFDYLIDEGIEATVVLTSSGDGSSSSGLDFSSSITNISIKLFCISCVRLNLNSFNSSSFLSIKHLP